jgi:hypothetical protein
MVCHSPSVSKPRLKNADLADVVQISAPIKGQLIVAQQPQRLAERDAISGETLAMQARVAIAVLHGLRQGEQNSFGFLQRINQGFVAEHGADAGPDDGGLERLDEKFVGSGFDAGDFILRALDAGGHQNGDELGLAVGFELTAEIGAAHFGHHQIHHHQVDLFAFQQGDGE